MTAARIAWLVPLWLPLAACNLVLGIEEGTLDESIGARDAALPRADAGGDECVLTSHCAENQVCLFRVCSPPCESQRDCAAGERCLVSEDGAACVSEARNQCGSDDDCPGATRCLDGRCQSRCGDGDGGVQCPPGQLCVEGACRLAPDTDAGTGDAGTSDTRCEPDTLRCVNDASQRCGDDGTWQTPTPCTYVCGADGACAGECVPDEARCTDQQREVCDEAGEWQPDQTCPALCTPAGCVASCEPGERLCNGLKLLTCNDKDQFVETQVCPYVCTLTNGQAECTGECVPDSKNCVGSSLELCDARGQWGSSANCDFVCTGNACAGECLPDARQCVDATSFQECSEGGFWQATTSCTQQACAAANGACVGSCSPGTTRCGAGQTVETCNDTGSWAVTQTCTDQACVSASCQGVCSPGARRCDAGSSGFQECQSNGTWGATTACGAAACVSGQCTGTCSPTTMRCKPGSGVVIQTCDGQGVWQDSATCMDQACVSGGCTGICEPGEPACTDSDSFHVCQANGSYGATMDCSGQACVAGDCTGVCTPGGRRCETVTQFQVCSATGQWGANQGCSNQACMAGTCVGVCSPGALRCQPGQNVAQRCNDSGQWVTHDTCMGPDELCQAGACADNDPYTLGYDEVGGAGWGTYEAPANYVFAQPITVTANVNVLSVHVRASVTPNPGVLARMAIYADAGGAPGARLALSNNFSVVQGTNGIALSEALSGGTTYWLAAIFSGSAPIYRNTASSSPDAYLYPGAFSTLPDPFPVGSATLATDRAYSLSMIVQNATP